MKTKVCVVISSFEMINLSIIDYPFVVDFILISMILMDIYDLIDVSMNPAIQISGKTDNGTHNTRSKECL